MPKQNDPLEKVMKKLEALCEKSAKLTKEIHDLKDLVKAMQDTKAAPPQKETGTKSSLAKPVKEVAAIPPLENKKKRGRPAKKTP